jgi:type IV pilus assembly protein PilZ
MDDLEFKEKRKYPRAPIVTEIFCSDLPEDKRRGQGMLCFYSRDISVGGIFLETSLPIEIGSMVYLRFTMPDSFKPILTQARITRTSEGDPDLEPGMGIEFEHLSFADKKLIDSYVKSK